MPHVGNRLATLFFQHRGKAVDKWEQYLGIYERELAPFLETNQAVRLLEIGVQNGGSLELWSEYLPAGSEIVGIDIDPKVGSLTFNGSVQAHVVDATDEWKIAALLGGRLFDVIIDDGSHVSSDVIATFKLLFGRLAFGGKYIIEDLHASYWPSFGGGLHVGASAIEFLKGLVDALNADYLDQTDALPEELRRYAPSLACVAFYDSVAVVEKLACEKPFPYRRMLSGVKADVVEPFVGVISMPAAKIGLLLLADEQKHRVEAGILDRLQEMTRVAAENLQLKTELAQLTTKFAQLTTQFAQTEAGLDARIKQLDANLQNVLRSSSWRITSPLRESAHHFRRATQAILSARRKTKQGIKDSADLTK